MKARDCASKPVLEQRGVVPQCLRLLPEGSR
jgi:hypothetical protein